MIARIFVTIGCACIALALGACGESGPRSVERYEQGDYRGAYAAQRERLAAEPAAYPAEDEALEYLRAGVLAAIVDERRAALDLLHQADLRLEAAADAAPGQNVFGRDPAAPFRGHPYERVYPLTLYGMLTYAVGGEQHYREALAAFQRAIAEDSADELEAVLSTSAAGSENRDLLAGDADALLSDSAINHYLSGLALLRLGERERAASELARAQAQVERLGELGYPVPPDELFDPDALARSNLLVVVGTGRAPRKERGAGPAPLIVPDAAPAAAAARVLVDGEVVDTTWVIEDLFQQASTRGPLAIDEAFAHLPEANTGPDLRQLEFLPATFQVLPLTIAAESAEIEIEFVDAFGIEIPVRPEARHRVDLPAPGSGQALIYAHGGRNEGEESSPWDSLESRRHR